MALSLHALKGVNHYLLLYFVFHYNVKVVLIAWLAVLGALMPNLQRVCVIVTDGSDCLQVEAHLLHFAGFPLYKL